MSDIPSPEAAPASTPRGTARGRLRSRTPTSALRRPARRSRSSPLGALGVVYGDIGTSPLYALTECFSGPHGVAPTPDERARRPLARVLGADVRRHLQVPRRSSCAPTTAARAASSRSWRSSGRHGTGRRRPRRAPRARALRRGAALRRRRHHAGHLGARRGGGRLGRRAGAHARRRAGHGRRSSSCSSSSRSAAPRRSGRCSARSCSSGSSPSRSSGCAASCSTRRSSRASTPRTRSRSSSATAWHGFLVLGAVVLVVTGGEALYADMGHFGKRPIRVAWLPRRDAGAAPQLLRAGRAAAARPARGPRTRSTCSRRRGPLLPDDRDRDRRGDRRVAGAHLRRLLAHPPGGAARLLARASRSCTRRHDEIGQIYIPEVNWALAVGTVALVLGFRSSSAPRRRVRHRGDRDDDDHDAPLPPCRARRRGAGRAGARWR